ncbi:MAG: hypothetical protein RIM23_27935 [Coleofasciculus sp. G3-WIS-01]|uniref:hypothetical protein n=1 Tax=Coleofasciculus sp. G3-WIS-01 TaxID=3069528 RepID=UPI0032F75103
MGELRQKLATMSPERQRYALETLPTHFGEAGQFQRLHRLLTDFDFIEAKLDALGVQSLIQDYEFVENPETLRLIQGALRLSAHILVEDKTQLAGQLWGRLISFKMPEIQAMLQQIEQRKQPWLRLLTPSLISPGGALLRTFEGHRSSISSIVVTPDGKQLISGSLDHSIRIWNFQTGEQLLTLTGHSEWVNAIALTPDSKRVISGSSDKTIKVWDVNTGREILTLEGHTDAVVSVAVTPDGKRLISGSWDKTIKLWDLENGKNIKTIKAHTDRVKIVSITPDGKLLISSGLQEQPIKHFPCDTIKGWNLADLTEVFTLWSNPEFLENIAISPDGKYLISAGIDTIIWNLETREHIFTFCPEIERVGSSVSTLTVTPDSKLLISGLANGVIQILDLNTKKELVTWNGHVGAIFSLVMTPDGKHLISGSSDQTIKIWDLEAVKAKKILIQNERIEAIKTITVTPDGQQAISGSEDGYIKVWNLENGKKSNTFTDVNNFRNSVHDLVVTPDGKQVIAGLRSGNIESWNLKTGKNLKTFKGHTRHVNAIAVTPDGKQLISGSADMTVKIWNLETGEEAFTFTEHTGYVWHVKVTPDGKHIISSSMNQTIYWELETKKIIYTQNGFANWRKTIVVDPPRKWEIYIVSGTIKIFNLETKNLITSFTGDTWLNCYAIAPDGITIVAGEASGRLHFLRLENSSAFDSECNR